MNRKILIKLVVGIFVLAVIVVGGLAWLGSGEQTTQTNTNRQSNQIENAITGLEDWKTYNNAKYGFTFKYPGDWYMFEETSGDYQRVYIRNVSGNVDKETAPADYQGLWIAFATGEADENPYNLSGSKKYTVENNGITMNYYEWPPSYENDEPTMEAYWVNQKNGDKFMANCASEVGVENSKQEVAVLKKILSTFAYQR